MANESKALIKQLKERGYEILPPTRRGESYYQVVDPRTGTRVGSFPVKLKTGALRGNLLAAIRRYERTGAVIGRNWST